MASPLPHRCTCFPLWAALLSWLLVLSLATTPVSARASLPAPPAPALIDDGGGASLALPRDAGGHWQRRADDASPPDLDPAPPAAPLPAAASLAQTRAPDIARPPAPYLYHRPHPGAPRAPPSGIVV